MFNNKEHNQETDAICLKLYNNNNKTLSLWFFFFFLVCSIYCVLREDMVTSLLVSSSNSVDVGRHIW